MTRLRSPLFTAFLALCVGLAMLCTLARPVFTTMQEMHELGHVADSAGPDDAAIEDVFHAPHCCVHAFVLPPTLMVALTAVTQAPPGFVPDTPSALPLSRFLRPPITA